MRPYGFTGTAVVTGAASGIGAALAPALAARGNDLVLLDRDADRLTAVAASVRAAFPGRAVDTLVADLADAGQLRDAADALVTGHAGTTLLVNNAGVALGGRFDQVTLEEFDWVMDVNFRAAVRLTHALLPVLKAQPGSHLVNVSSIFGIMAPAGQAAYASSKFAIRGFTEAVRHELADDGVGVTSVHPGGIATRIAESARVGSGVDPAEAEEGKREFARFLRYPADRAAARIVTAVERRRPRLLVGASAVVPDLLVRLAPGSYGKLLAGATRLAGQRRS
ncbi:Short-chain dehydrogenase [Geodermatophilus obscurus]|uniref:Short-chain dehydrogenase n=1 Tax=Geodermatophilus obscurus TaxID=1861 RepID=A0A1I5C4I4_9ACTN|nr:SDR family oxidoreductase [Geodermatophilus obscurus]SFN81561.1 Short-chain dehydrogenase [Geodermatophilus obscurus]